jgi:hypothetical protein
VLEPVVVEVRTVIAAVRAGGLDEVLAPPATKRATSQSPSELPGPRFGKYVSSRELTVSTAKRNLVGVMQALPDTSEQNRLCAIRNVPKGCEARRHKD